jgi:hypothetical protein
MACAFANLKAVLDDVFGIEIPMDEIERATTLEGLADYLGDKLRRTPNAISPDVVAAFLDIRRAVAVVMKRPKSEIQTSTNWKALLPETSAGRRQVWREIQKISQASLPRLAWPGWTWGVMYTVGMMMLLPLAYVGFGQGTYWIGAILLLLALKVFVTIGRATGTELPHQTVAESARYVATERWTPSKVAYSPWTSAEVLKPLRELFENESGEIMQV